MFKTRDWFIIAPIGVVAFALAFWGFYPCHGEACKPEPWWKVGEHSFNLIRGRGDFSLDKDPWQLVIAQYLLPGVAVFAAAKLFLINLRRDMRVAFAHKSRNHAIVCGLGATGRRVVDNLRSLGHRVVVVDLDSEAPSARSCEHAGVPVIKGDATSGRTLELAGLCRARHLIATTGNDATNFEIALQAREIRCKSAKSIGKLNVHAEVRAGWLLNEVANHRSATLASDTVEIRPFSQYENAVRLLYRSATFARRRKLLTPGVPHLVVVGFGRMGQEIVARGIRNALAVPSVVPNITVFDRSADAITPFFAANPGANKIANIESIEASLGDDASGWSKLASVVAGHDVTAVVIAVADDDQGLSVGMRLRRHLDEHGRLATPVFARLRNNQTLGGFAANLEGVGPLRDRFIPFGSILHLTSASMLFEEQLDTIAHAAHATYREGASSDGQRPFIDLPWERLPEAYKQSNRSFADHVSVKLRAAGMRLRRSASPRPFVFTHTEVEALAATEHWRWMVEHDMAGWVYAESRDEMRRRHPALVPWESLPESMRERNRVLVRQLPNLLAKVNLEIRRERILSAVALDAQELTDVIKREGCCGGSEHLSIIVDFTDLRSLQAAEVAVGLPDVTVWLLLSERAITALGQEFNASEEWKRIWERSEGWVTMEEFDALALQPVLNAD
jgi:voltage-gated potassium channel Kch